MAYKIIEARISKMGFCCPYSYYFACRHLSTPDIATELGVTNRSARRWRAAYKAHTMICAKERTCFFNSTPSREIYPYSGPARVEDLDPVPVVALP